MVPTLPQCWCRLADRNFYGATEGGGNNNCPLGCGTVFKITPQGTLTTLHSFNGTDGTSPVAGLVLASDGNFYGGTDVGGTHNVGTIFKITSTGVLTTLYNFQGYPIVGVQDLKRRW